MKKLAEDYEGLGKHFGPLVQENQMFAQLKKNQFILEKFKFFNRHELHEELEDKLIELEAFINSVDENSNRSKDGRVTNSIINC